MLNSNFGTVLSTDSGSVIASRKSFVTCIGPGMDEQVAADWQDNASASLASLESIFSQDWYRPGECTEQKGDESA